MAALVTGFVFLLFLVGYRYYGRFVGERIFDDRDEILMPAHEFNDGLDFVPTQKELLFGHHFTSIAGAAPIIGPCVAAYWGWAPALFWVVFGTIFMGAVHDFGALVVSAREKGRSIPDIAGKVINGRVRVLFLCLVMVLSWLVLAVFAMAIGDMFVTVPSAVLPINIEIVVAVAIGWLIYRRRVKALVPSLIALVVLYIFVWLGVYFPLDFTIPEAEGGFGLSPADAAQGWVIFLLVYSAVASLLPVWILMQPRDYINSHQLVVGLGLLYVGLFIAMPDFDAPALRTPDAGAPSIFPLLFVTVACGAISGFHGLVSSGTTSKQLNALRDARLIGYGSMLGEGALALAATMCAVAGIGLVAACDLPGQGHVEALSWSVYYDSWAHAGANKATAFVLGGGAFLEKVGLPGDLARTVMAVIVISFAATTLDTATRIQRFIISELGGAIRMTSLQNPYTGTALAVIPAAVLATLNVSDPASGATVQAGWVLWPIFGASNQMIAALSLLVMALYFVARHKPVLPLLIPMAFIMLITGLALAGSLKQFWVQENWLLFMVTVVLSGLMLWMTLEGLAMLQKTLRARASMSQSQH
jgi:carbon starvation protein